MFQHAAGFFFMLTTQFVALKSMNEMGGMPSAQTRHSMEAEM